MKPSNLLKLGPGLLLLARLEGVAQPIPHHFSRLDVLPDQSVALSLDGSVSNMFNLTGTISNQFMSMYDFYVIEASPNLTDWGPLARLLRTNNNPTPLVFRDTNAAGANQHFYRTFTNHLLTAFPKPSGPFTVGTVDRVMIDPARTNLYRYSPPTNAFMVTVWYPADPPPAGVLPAPMWNTLFGSDTSFYVHHGVDTRWASVAPKLAGHRFRELQVAADAAPFPVVLCSHGVPGGGRRTESQIAEELASHGYVVVGIDHPDCWASAFPDGRYLTGNRSGDLPGRLRDMEFLLDELARLNRSDVIFSGCLDLDRIGVAGISYGGMVVETCRSDSRVRCAAIWDGTNLQLNGAGLQKPFLAAAGEVNCCFSQAQWLFGKAITNATILQVRGADHLTGSDAAWTAELPGGRAPALAIEACFVWFFDTYLKGETPPFPANPQIYNVQRK